MDLFLPSAALKKYDLPVILLHNSMIKYLVTFREKKVSPHILHIKTIFKVDNLELNKMSWKSAHPRDTSAKEYPA